MSEPNTNFIAALRKGLGEIGYVEGQNVAFEFRWAEGRTERLPALATGDSGVPISDLDKRSKTQFNFTVGTRVGEKTKGLLAGLRDRPQCAVGYSRQGHSLYRS